MTTTNTAVLADATGAVVVQVGTVYGGVFAHQQGRPVPAQLPVRPATFVNREHDVAALRTLLARPTTARLPRVVVFTGPAGIGKTALATVLVQDHHEQFPDGQLLLDLRHSSMSRRVYGNPIHEALANLLRGLGMAAQDVPATVEEAAASYRTLTSGRALALLVDDVTDWGLVHAVLPPSDRALVLVTTRAQPDPTAVLDGAHIHPLERLTPDDSHALVSRILGSRAGDEPGPANRLVAICGGVPGALVGAATTARADHDRSLRDYVATLTALTRSRGTDVPDPLDVSYRRLSAEAAQLHQLLGCWSAPTVDCGVIAALMDCAHSDAERLARELQNIGLLEDAGPARWSRSVAVQEHQQALGAELAPTEVNDALRRAAEFYWSRCGVVDNVVTSHRPHRADHVPGYRPDTVPEFDRAAALEWMGTELETILWVALAVHERGLHRLAWEILDRLWPVLVVVKRYELRESIDTAFLTVAVALDEPESVAESNKRLGMFLRSARRHDDALTTLTQARDIWTGLGNLGDATQAAQQIALVHLEGGQAELAVTQLRDCLATQESLDAAARTLALLRVDLARALLATNRWQDAIASRELAEDAWHALAAAEDRYNAARARVVLGRAYTACAWGDAVLDQLTTAKTLLTDAMADLGEFGSSFEVALAKMALAPVEARLGPLLAKALLTEAGEMLRGLGSPLAAEAFTQRSALSGLGTGL